jgi:hypothetical protein
MFQLNLKTLLNDDSIGQNDENMSNEDAISVDCISLDSTKTYLTFFDSRKQLWLFKVATSTRLACLSLYGTVQQLKFTIDNKYVCLNMNDRRIFTLLIVDPNVHEHETRIRNLPSRQVAKRDVKKVKKLIKNKVKTLMISKAAKKLGKLVKEKDDQTDRVNEENEEDEEDELKKNEINQIANELDSSDNRIDSSSSSDSCLSADSSSERKMNTEILERKQSVRENVKQESIANANDELDDKIAEKKRDESKIFVSLKIIT